MLSFVTSQAIALSQAKQKSSKSPASGQQAAPRMGKGFLARVFDALFEARMRRAEMEIEHHRRFHDAHTK